MSRVLTLITACAVLVLSGCFSPNPFAIMNAGPHIASVTPPASPIDGQPSHWRVDWKGGQAPYSIQFTAYAAVPFAAPDDGIKYEVENIKTPYEFDVTLPDRNPGLGYDVSWRLEIRDSLWSEDSGGGNPFFPSYVAMDQNQGTITTHAP